MDIFEFDKILEKNYPELSESFLTCELWTDVLEIIEYDPTADFVTLINIVMYNTDGVWEFIKKNEHLHDFWIEKTTMKILCC